MDAFFAAVEVLDNPSLEGKPVIVGGTSNRGVVSTASYEARKFGVHSAMPLFKAKERCPQGIFLTVRKGRYAEVSRKIMDILEEFSPLVEQVSIDEAYLDITGTEDLFGSPEEVARRIKERIRTKTHLTCSIGIAPNRFLAKVASEMNKPDGLTIVTAQEMDEFLAGLPVEKLSGVGKRTVEGLKRHGIEKVGDLRRFSKERLVKEFGKFGLRLHELARGQDDSQVVPSREIKSISSEHTLPADTRDMGLLKKLVRSHADQVAWRLRREGFQGRTITVKMRFSDFSFATRAHTFEQGTDNSAIIAENATKLLLDYPLKKKIRLIGVAVSNLKEIRKDEQLNLFAQHSSTAKERKVDEAVDAIRKRFGGKIITRGDT
jgi:DNA polymerase-4